jgi:hypothetical protein
MRRLRKPPGLFRRIGAALLLAWVLGFLWFALALPRPAGTQKTDGVIALTGAGGRIPRAIEVLRAGQARKLLVAGVASEVKPGEFAAEYEVSPPLLACCVTLGFGFYMLHNTLQVMASQMSAQSRATAVGLFAVSIFFGQASGVAIAARITPIMGQGRLIIVSGILMALLGSILAWRVSWKSQ